MLTNTSNDEPGLNDFEKDGVSKRSKDVLTILKIPIFGIVYWVIPLNK